MPRRRAATTPSTVIAVPCRAVVAGAGLPGRTDRVLARETGLLAGFTAEVERAAMSPGDALSTAEPGAITSSAPDPGTARQLTIADVLTVLAQPTSSAAPAAAFLAGRCAATDDHGGRLREALMVALDTTAPTGAHPRSLVHVHAALSAALRGDVERGAAALRAMVAARNTLDDALGAYHLAQLGDPSGYALVCDGLSDATPHMRTMAARALVAFLPWNGEIVDGHTVDVVASLRGLLDDPSAQVSREIPALLAEADPVAALPLLEDAARHARHDETRTVADFVTRRLRDAT